ncbi:MAG: NAD+ synthase [Rhodospirillaceae bacterium]|nr:NAD+ synthase [Rhodospirillaceae bacterium]
MKIGVAQINLHVGSIESNAQKVLETAHRARDELHCDLVVFPELTLSGYPPEDLLFHRGMRLRVQMALEKVRDECHGIALFLGYPEYDSGYIYNSGAFIFDGRVVALHRKIMLPNYAVFDEKRYFQSGSEPTVVEYGGIQFGLTICEDVWSSEPCINTVNAGAEIILVLNGSPFHRHKQNIREDVLISRAKEIKRPILYVNMVGGQDELVFDGGSMAVSDTGSIVFRAPEFLEDLSFVNLKPGFDGICPTIEKAEITPELSYVESVYKALVVGTRDYVKKNGFEGVILGLSGGIDSALTLCVAVDALGANCVQAVMMPSKYTSEMSKQDATIQANNLGVHIDNLPIDKINDEILELFHDLFGGLGEDATEENIQSRCRGILLMAMSNKLGKMLLTTGNKSEMAVGYATLYGDMAGGFAPLKDCNKTLVYELAYYRNNLSDVIPERVLTREPTAELRFDQKDTDSLPPYHVLDPILDAFIERDLSVDQIAELGYERETVFQILEMVKRSEYKRRQAPPGVRVSRRAFGRDWRYPITSGY